MVVKYVWPISISKYIFWILFYVIDKYGQLCNSRKYSEKFIIV